jgi:hypothetical protein
MEIFLPLSPEINEYALFQNFTKIIHSMKQFGILENTKEITVHSGIVWRDKIYGDRQ